MIRIFCITMLIGLLLTNCYRSPQNPVDPDGILYRIPFISDAIIDGSNDDWNQKGFNAQLFANHLGEFVKETNLSANFSLAWNNEGLLVFVDVRDDMICEAEEGIPLFKADCIEMFIANRRNGTDAVQFVVAPGVDHRSDSQGIMKFDKRRSKELRQHDLELISASNKTDKGYSFEAMIPFDILKINSKEGEEFAFQIYVNDRDKSDQKQVHSIKWQHRHGADGYLSAYNRIVLSKEASPSQAISVKCNVIDEQLIRFYLVGDKKFAGKRASIHIGKENNFEIRLERKSDYSFAAVEVPYRADSSQQLAVISVDCELIDVINLEEAWRIYIDTKAPNRWLQDIEQFERMDEIAPPPKDAILFIGDSNIRLWTMLQEDMEGLTVFNRGFGGSQSGDLVLYADRIILPYKPKAIVIGSGNNDVNAGLATGITISNYHQVIGIIHKELPETRIFLLSTKPSPGAPEIIPLKQALNPEIIKIAAKYDFVEYINVFDPLYDENRYLSDDLYIYDRSHLNERGYAIWAPIIKSKIMK